MCWCTPNLRTPWCGKPGCNPPTAGLPASPQPRTDKSDLQALLLRYSQEYSHRGDGIQVVVGSRNVVVWFMFDDAGRYRGVEAWP
jgi:hypothetical protein